MSSTAAAEPERARYRDVLGQSEFRALFGAHVASMTGDVVAAAALTVLVYQRTSSPLLASLTFSLVFAPHLLSGALVAAVIDRLPARATLVACHLASAVLVAAMALPGLPLPALFALLLGLGLLAPIFSGIRAALLPDLLPDRAQYVLGRSLLRLVAQGSQVGGNAIAAALLVVLHPSGALLVDAASFLLSALLVRAGTRPRRPHRPRSSRPAQVSVG